MGIKNHDARKTIARQSFTAGWLKARGETGPTITESIQLDIEFETWWREFNHAE